MIWKKFCASVRSQTLASHYLGEHLTTRLLRHLIAVTFTPSSRKHVLMHFELGDNTLATKCNSGSKWPLAIWKNSVPQQGVEPKPLTIWASIIQLDYRDTWSLSKVLWPSLAMMIANSCVQSSIQTPFTILFFHRHLEKTWDNQTCPLNGKPY